MGIFLIISSILLMTHSCQGQQTSCYSKMTTARGTFSSKWYPKPYPPNTFCQYVIRCPPNFYIEITFSDFKLERPYRGRLTDFITILDGGSKNRRQNVTYNGTTTAPIVFRSETTRVVIFFRSNEFFGYRGFQANYRRVKKCRSINVRNGKTDCDVNHLNLATHCNVTCEKKFVLRGERRIQCNNGQFLNVPTCKVRPEFDCTIENFRDLFKKTSKSWWITLESCVADNVTGMISKCNYECGNNYIDTGNGAIECIDGVIEHEAQCLPDPDVMERCLEPSNATSCPFNDKQTFLAEMEDARVMEELPEQSLGRSAISIAKVTDETGKPKKARVFKCAKQVCRVIYRGKLAGNYYWKCNKYAKFCQRVFKENNRKKKLRKTLCKGCQNFGCRTPNPFHVIYSNA